MLSQSAEEAQKGMFDMATELRELQGLPEAIQKQLETGWWKGQRERATHDDVTVVSSP